MDPIEIGLWVKGGLVVSTIFATAGFAAVSGPPWPRRRACAMT